ncbi:unnamed protein product [Rotaria sp. Silwood2]|nr:unnamed protein product [Rotaria sp. Silwood2]CAF4143154.1 unnamed protein product [Rotaria sp. Silwood2]
MVYYSFIFLNYSSASLVNGIVTISWSPSEPAPIIDRFLTNNIVIQLKILYRESTSNANTNIEIRGRIGHVIGCLPLQSDVLLSATQEDKNAPRNSYQIEVSPSKAIKLREKQTQINKNKKTRRATDEKLSPLVNGLRSSTGTLLTSGNGYYLIEIYPPKIIGSDSRALYVDVDADVVRSMKNKYGHYITADEYPSLVFLYSLCNCKTAEILSCLKCTISRMLVIIIAIDYGIVKSRLGPLKQTVLGMGILFYIEDVFWHILLSIILLVIMFLFRPSNNNQRYAFVPLLDQSDNDDDAFGEGDEE